MPTAAAAAAAGGVGGGGGQYVDAALAQTPAPAVAASGRFQRAMAGLLGSPATASVLRGASIGLGFTVHTMLDKAVQLYVDDGRNDYFLLYGSVFYGKKREDTHWATRTTERFFNTSTSIHKFMAK